MGPRSPAYLALSLPFILRLEVTQRHQGLSFPIAVSKAFEFVSITSFITTGSIVVEALVFADRMI